MYATCLWCQQSLGRNEVVEAFPVGRRLAFDAAKGRLWVVCPACERWNLTPMEERWDAIETCERLYRDTRTRASTGEIGLARARDGLALVRIGAPLLPEFAAWRYGDQFGRRFRRTAVLTTAAVLAVSAAAYGQLVMGASVLGLTNLINPAWQVYRRKKRAASLEVEGGRHLPVSVFAAGMTRVSGDGGALQVAVPTSSNRLDHWSGDIGNSQDDVFAARARLAHGLKAVGTLDPRDFAFFDGDAAHRALGQLLPVVNRDGGTKGTIADSVRLLESSGTPERRAEAVLRGKSTATTPIASVDKVRRLALEIAVHEADERRWMDGELAELERRWKEAEALAAIADRLPLAPGATE
jgi:hypothetical protein